MEINKGIGRNVEFKGLESQYLFIFCGSLPRRVRGVRHPVHGGREPVGVHRFGVAAATLLVWLTFRLNAGTARTG